MTDTVLLSTREMYQADRLTIDGGVPGLALMEAAGLAVVREISNTWPEPGSVAILAGPGNNGGDGFVVARHLKDRGWLVRLGLLGTVDGLKGDAKANADRWDGPVEALSPELLEGSPLVVDALFGAGLERDIGGVAADILTACDDRRLDVVAVDIPSGVHGDTGAVMGAAATARITVTFFRAKPGHLLGPGRSRCGRVVVADIGIPESVLDEIMPRTFVNAPGLWLSRFPRPRAEGHKYTRGHGVVWGGDSMTGAARLAARGARRAGIGLLTIACDAESAAIYRAGDPGNIVVACATPRALGKLLADPRKNAILIGPGAGVGNRTRDLVLRALKAGKTLVLDADGLTSFEKDNDRLFAAVGSGCVMTPHRGEFDRLFGPPERKGTSKVERTRNAAALVGATVVFKGPDTVVATPDGLAAINANAPAELATGGSGDVLAGMILGLLAQGMKPGRAAMAGVWLHGAAAKSFGPGLIAEDIAEALPGVLARLKDDAGENGLR